MINNAAVASLAAAAAAHSYHQHRNRRNSPQYNSNSPNAGSNNERECNQPNNHPQFYGANLNSQDNSNQSNANVGSSNTSTSAPMSHLRNPLNIGHLPGQRLPSGYRHNLQQGKFHHLN